MMLKPTLPGKEYVALPSVDYCTITYDRTYDLEIWDTIDYLVKLMKSLKHVQKDWKTSLANGKQVGSLKYGHLRRSESKNIVSMSGAYSSILARWASSQIRTSRIDFCVDVFPSKKEAWLMDMYNELWKEDTKKKGSKSKYRFYGSAANGFTLYHGKGKGGYLLRIYDKGSQIEGRNGIWIRYELQIGRDIATDARKKWLNSDNPSDWIVRLLEWYMTKNDVEFGVLNRAGTEFVRASRIEDSSNEKQRAVAWLRETVSPFVKRASSLLGEDTVMRELGLDRYWVRKSEQDQIGG